MQDTEVLIEDPTAPAIFYDNITKPEVLHGVVRMIAYVRKLNVATGMIERLQVATFMRPVETTATVYVEIAKAAGKRVEFN